MKEKKVLKVNRRMKVLVAGEDPVFLKMTEEALKEPGGLDDIEKVSSGTEMPSPVAVTKRVGI